ncbi:UNVERIFIED_CONTAM: hypothetical protein HDU68_010358 [Siphonaria sp. JEL0065]|nr:hypothetical protein HDU68_010358 [Siphonaria sp. JEL0065]
MSFDIDEIVKSREGLTQVAPQKSLTSRRQYVKPVESFDIDEILVSSRDEVTNGSPSLSKPQSRCPSVGATSFKFFAKETTPEVLDIDELLNSPDNVRGNPTSFPTCRSDLQQRNSELLSASDDIMPSYGFDSMVIPVRRDTRLRRKPEAKTTGRKSEDNILDGSTDQKSECSRPVSIISLALSLGEFKQTADQLKEAFIKLVGHDKAINISPPGGEGPGPWDEPTSISPIPPWKLNPDTMSDKTTVHVITIGRAFLDPDSNEELRRVKIYEHYVPIPSDLENVNLKLQSDPAQALLLTNAILKSPISKYKLSDKMLTRSAAVKALSIVQTSLIPMFGSWLNSLLCPELDVKAANPTIYVCEHCPEHGTMARILRTMDVDRNREQVSEHLLHMIALVLESYWENHPRKIGDSDELLSGHHGVTPSSVMGLLRVTVHPQSAVAHSRMLTKPRLEVRFRGLVETVLGKSRSRKLPEFKRTSKVLMDEKLSFPDSLDLGLRTDDDNGLSMLVPGTYEVPFRFNLASVLPPSFDGFGGRISYTLSVGKFTKTFYRRISQPIHVRRYNMEHIISPSPDMIPSVPYREPVQHQRVSSSPASSFIDSQKFDFSRETPAESRAPEISGSSHIPAIPIGLPLARVASFSSLSTLTAEDDFSTPVVFSGTYSPSKSPPPPIQYQIQILQRSLGPSDPLHVRIHIPSITPEIRVSRVVLRMHLEVTTRDRLGTSSVVKREVGNNIQDKSVDNAGLVSYQDVSPTTSLDAVAEEDETSDTDTLAQSDTESNNDAEPPVFDAVHNEFLKRKDSTPASACSP